MTFWICKNICVTESSSITPTNDEIILMERRERARDIEKMFFTSRPKQTLFMWILECSMENLQQFLEVDTMSISCQKKKQRRPICIWWDNNVKHPKISHLCEAFTSMSGGCRNWNDAAAASERSEKWVWKSKEISSDMFDLFCLIELESTESRHKHIPAILFTIQHTQTAQLKGWLERGKRDKHSNLT